MSCLCLWNCIRSLDIVLNSFHIYNLSQKGKPLPLAMNSYISLFMYIYQRYNTTFTCYKECGSPQGSELAFLLLWPTGFQILPFKVRPLSVSLYPHVSLILLSPGGAHKVPLSLSHSLYFQVCHAVTSAAGSFSEDSKKETAAGSHLFNNLFGRAFYTFWFAETLNVAQAVK